MSQMQHTFMVMNIEGVTDKPKKQPDAPKYEFRCGDIGYDWPPRENPLCKKTNQQTF